MKKRTSIEGSAPARIVQLMRLHGENKDVSIDLGTVKVAPPNLKIQLDADGLLLEKGDIILAEHLTEHTRTHKINSGTVGQITFYNDLKVNDKVIVVGDNDTQFYYVIDKAVIF